MGGVTEADRPLDIKPFDLGDDRCERAIVAVDVGDECDRHRSTIGRP